MRKIRRMDLVGLIAIKIANELSEMFGTRRASQLAGFLFPCTGLRRLCLTELLLGRM